MKIKEEPKKESAPPKKEPSPPKEDPKFAGESM